MKKITIITIAISLLAVRTVMAQGWNQDKSGIYSLGVGGTDVIIVSPAYRAFAAGGTSLNVSGEYRVQRFIGIGFETGLDFFVRQYYPATAENPSLYFAMAIPAAFKMNVHILEAANVPIASSLDVYAGINIGGGLAFNTGPGVGTYGFFLA